MKKFLRAHVLLTSCVVLVGISVLIWTTTRSETPTWTTAVVEQGTIRNTISVSGAVDAVSTANLSFPVSGTLHSIDVEEGNFVTKGQLLATLLKTDLEAEAQDAIASLHIAQSDYEELVNGLRTEERDISKTTAAIAKEELVRVTNEQNDRVQNAYNTLLSSDLEARPEKNDNNDTPPIISGTYTCTEGTYTLEIFKSNAQSGYSYRLSGLEDGTYTAYTETPAPLGKCGLMAQFTTGENYRSGTWFINIPNSQSSNFVTNQNAYNLALTQRTNAIHEAEQRLTLAEQQSTLETATPRKEVLARAEAKILQAQARIAGINAQMSDHKLVAPFDGTITTIEPVVGEAVGVSPIITMVSNSTFALTALIPEIDITKISVGQKADVVFDARQDETLVASIIFISPLAKEIDGVSYFEAKLVLDESVDWLRSGLNADIDIIIEKRENVTRIPKRFLITENDTYFVLVPDREVSKKIPITLEFEGNDGYVAVRGVDINSTIIAP